MPAIITSNFRQYNARTFRRFISNEFPDAVYFAIGRHTDWDIDSQPPVPSDSDEETIYRRYDRLLAAFRVDESDTAFMAPRYDWETDTVYDQYDPTDGQLDQKMFYVRSSANNIYKVLDNNDGAASTVEPTGTSLDTFTTADGYTWKYMYTIEQADADKFMTPNYMPVFVDSNVRSNAESSMDVPYTEPFNGHGYDPVEELRAFYVIVTVEIGGAIHPDLFIDNDYREINLWFNPLKSDGSTIADQGYYNMAHDINSTTITGEFLPDEVIVDQDAGTTTQGRVVMFDQSNGVIRYKPGDASEDFNTGATIEGTTTGATAVIGSIDTPNIEQYSGQFLVAEHRPRITRAENQTETLVTILEF